MSKIKYRGPVVLVIMDGVGLSSNKIGNAVELAYTETLDKLMAERPMLSLRASGADVGLTDGQMGNSEVGHYTMGSGTTVKQALPTVDEAFTAGALFSGKTWRDSVKNVLDNDSTMHFIGILSDGRVHSDINHLLKMIEQADRENIQRVRVHVLLDGRDVAARSEPRYIDMLEEFLAGFNAKGRNYRIASGGGRELVTANRYWSDKDMMRRGLDTHVHGTVRPFTSAKEAIDTFRREDPEVDDQRIPAFAIVDSSGSPVGKIQEGDTVINYNFRADRAIQFSEMMTAEDKDFPYFDRGTIPKVRYVGLVKYDQGRSMPEHTLVDLDTAKSTLAELEIRNGIKRFVISESIKFGHVTFYFNGGKEGKFSDEMEEYVDLPNKIGKPWQFPWMKSDEITDILVEKISSGKFDSIVVNYPNGDMVGHEARVESSIVAVEAVDIALSRILQAVDEAGGVALITADHGNVEETFYLDDEGEPKLDEDGHPIRKTSHTSNPVPFIIYDNTENKDKYQLKQGSFGLSNIAATVAMLHGLEPDEGWQESLIGLRASD